MKIHLPYFPFQPLAMQLEAQLDCEAATIGSFDDEVRPVRTVYNTEVYGIPYAEMLS